MWGITCSDDLNLLSCLDLISTIHAISPVDAHVSDATNIAEQHGDHAHMPDRRIFTPQMRNINAKVAATIVARQRRCSFCRGKAARHSPGPLFASAYPRCESHESQCFAQTTSCGH